MSEETMNAKEFLLKVKEDQKRLKSLTRKYKGEIDTDVYNKAYKEALVVAKNKINNLKNSIAIGVSNPNSISIVENISKRIYKIVAFIGDHVYHSLTMRYLEEEKEETYSFASLLLSLIVGIGVFTRAVDAVLPPTTLSGAILRRNILAVVFAPLYEEWAKAAALNISKSVGVSFTARFAAIEAVGYIAAYYQHVGPKIIFFRILAFMMHMGTLLSQKYIKDKTEYRYLAYMVGVIMHAVWNIGALKMS